MSLQSSERVRLLEIRVHEIEIRIRKLERPRPGKYPQ